MPLINWNGLLESRVSEIDNQNKKIVDKINYLFEAQKKYTDKKKLKHIFKEISIYLEQHFSAEEELMSNFNYPYSSCHIEAHKEFLELSAKYSNELEKGEKEIDIELLRYYKDWISDHIIIMDKKLGKFLIDKL